MPSDTTKTTSANLHILFRFFGFSFIGIVVFFVPVSIAGVSTITLDHIVTFITRQTPVLGKTITLCLIVCGGLLPFFDGSWKNNRLSRLLSVLKLLAIPLAVMYLLDKGPAVILDPKMVPFLFEKLAMPVGLIVPIGSVFLSLLVGYGLLEFVGALLEPVMRPLWKTPGRSAIDAVASFAGSYSIGLLITNRIYKEGKYSAREAAIIATGFSTVSATFMVVVAKTLNLMEIWTLYFWSTLLITFAITAITVNIPPLSKLDNRASNRLEPGGEALAVRFRRGYREGLETARSSAGLIETASSNFIDGLKMSVQLVPSLLSIGLLGLLAVKFTPVFEWIGYAFYPLLKLFQVDQAAVIATSIATGFAEMFLPALSAADLPFVGRYIVAVTSVSTVLFLSGSIPCILATEIPLSLPGMAVIWLQRALLSLLLATPAAFLLDRLQ